MSDAASSSSSAGGFGGEKKLKNESVGTVFLTIRVCFVSTTLLNIDHNTVMGARLTLVSLLLLLNLDSQVLA